VKTYQISPSAKGSFDHLAVDLKRNRLFVTPEDFKSVLVFDLSSGNLIRRIEGIARPHAILYRSDVDRLYVTDGGDGLVRVFDGETYRCDLRGPACRDIHPLEREPRQIAARPPSAGTARTVAAAPVDGAIPRR